MKIIKEKILYHGSGQVVETPDLNHSREDIDFGAGFYLTEDKYIAKKWACTKRNSYVSEYKLDLSGLKVYQFKLDKEWLKYVVDNRLFNLNKDYDKYDVLIGPTADNKLYDTLQDYLDGYINEKQAIKYLNIVGYSNQIVLKSDDAIKQIEFIIASKIHNLEKEQLRNLVKNERKQIITKLSNERKNDINNNDIVNTI